MTALERIAAELERYFDTVGIAADRIVVPAQMLREALEEACCRGATVGPVGVGGYLYGARIEVGEVLQARASRIAGFTIEQR